MATKFTIGDVEVEFGARVTAKARWKDGRVTTISGSLITIKGDSAYIRTTVGAVEVDRDSLELDNG